MIIISMDPGLSTGIAMLNTETGELYRTTLPLEDAYRYVAEECPCDYLLVETMPVNGGWNLVLIEYYNKFIKMPYARRISPGNWKPLAKANDWDNTGKTPHEKDAYNMLRFWYLVNFRVDIGSR